MGVAPLVGAWIEIPTQKPYLVLVQVAPLVGAWIEIQVKQKHLNLKAVAPLVGAWIEIDTDSVKGFEWDSRSSRGSVD